MKLKDKRRVLIWIINIILAYLLITLAFTMIMYLLSWSIVYTRPAGDVVFPPAYNITDECIVMNYNDVTEFLIPLQPPNEEMQILLDEWKIRYVYEPSIDTCIGTAYRKGGSLILNNEEIGQGGIKEGSHIGINLLDPWLLEKEFYYIKNEGRYTCLDTQYVYEELDFRSEQFDFVLVKVQCSSKYIFNFLLFFVLILLYFARRRIKKG